MRVGEHTGAGEYADENRSPWTARRSVFGVWKTVLFAPGTSGRMATDTPAQPWSSESMRTMFGLPAAGHADVASSRRSEGRSFMGSPWVHQRFRTRPWPVEVVTKTR